MAICNGTTKAGTPCKNKASKDHQRCHLHKGEHSITAKTHDTPNKTCGAATKSGGLCKNRPSKGHQRCHLHKGAHQPKSPKSTTPICMGTKVNGDACSIKVKNDIYCRHHKTQGLNHPMEALH